MLEEIGIRINASKTHIMTNLVLAQNIRIGDSDINTSDTKYKLEK